jgi:hypothetical protein
MVPPQGVGQRLLRHLVLLSLLALEVVCHEIVHYLLLDPRVGPRVRLA